MFWKSLWGSRVSSTEGGLASHPSKWDGAGWMWGISLPCPALLPHCSFCWPSVTEDTAPWPLLTSLMQAHWPSRDSFHNVTCQTGRSTVNMTGTENGIEWSPITHPAWKDVNPTDTKQEQSRRLISKKNMYSTTWKNKPKFVEEGNSTNYALDIFVFHRSKQSRDRYHHELHQNQVLSITYCASSAPSQCSLLVALQA